MNALQKSGLEALVSQAVEWDCPLSNYTSFGIGGPAEALVKVADQEELQQLIKFVQEEKIPWRVLGRGSNILVRDEGFAGIAIILSGEFKKTRVETRGDGVALKVGAGHSLSKLSAMCMDQGFSGLEFACGIPGSVGGAVMMNAGAWGGEIADVLIELELVGSSGKVSYKKEELQFGYRSFSAPGDQDLVISSATFALNKGEPEEIRQLCRKYLDKRRDIQPAGGKNAGSMFKNPQGDSAGRLIDACGLKGEKVGGAEISVKHANFIVNRGDASAADVLQLMELIVDTVYRQNGIRLEPEVKVW